MKRQYKHHLSKQSEQREDEQAEFLPQGAPLPSDFWQSLTLDQLAEAQGVQPIQDISVLFGTWPGEINDEFEESILDLRRQSLAGRNSE